MKPFPLVLISMLSPGIAGALQWTEIRAPATAKITSLTAVGGVLLAGTGKGNIFRSEDGGMAWTRPALPAGKPVYSFSAFGDTLLAMRASYIIPWSDCFSAWCLPKYSPDVAESRNGGRDWSARPQSEVTRMAQSLDGTLWAVSYDSIFRRAPGAQAWTGRRFTFTPDPDRQQYTRNCQGLAALPGMLYAILDGRMYRADTGFSADSLPFARVGTGPAFGLYADSGHGLLSLSNGLYETRNQNHYPLDTTRRFGWIGRGETGLLAQSRDGDTLFRSQNRGRSWARAVEPVLPDSAVELAEASGTVAAWMGRTGELWLSARGGAWQRAGRSLAETDVVPVLMHGGKIWAVTHLGLAHGPIAGGEWIPESGPMVGSEAFLMVAAGGKIWAGSQYGIWVRDDARAEWTQVSRKPVSALAGAGSGVIAAVDNGNGSRTPHILVFCDASGSCRETPPGIMGDTRYDSYYRFYINRMRLLAVRGDTILASDSLLYRSRDGGRNWDTAYDWGSRTPHMLAWAGGRLLAIRNMENYRMGISRSTDLGTTWTFEDTLKDAGYPFKSGSDGERLYLLRTTGLVSTADGTHWVEEDANPPPAAISMALSGGYVAVGDGYGGLRAAPLSAAPTGLAPRPAPLKSRNARGFPDGLGRIRKANGALEARK